MNNRSHVCTRALRELEKPKLGSKELHCDWFTHADHELDLNIECAIQW